MAGRTTACANCAHPGANDAHGVKKADGSTTILRGVRRLVFVKWKGDVVNYFQGRYSHGRVEGINNKIKLIKRRALGYVNFDHFRRRVIIEVAGLHSSVPRTFF